MKKRGRKITKREYRLIVLQQREEIRSVQSALRDSEAQRELLAAEVSKLKWVRDEIEQREKRAIAREKRFRMVKR